VSARRDPVLGSLEWFQLGERDRVERVCASLLRLGVRHLRTGISWADWHRGAVAEEWYGWLLPRLARDFELLPCVHHTPPSLGLVATTQSPPRRPRDYADFLDQLVDRFGHLFEHVELWNEPNNLNDWNWRLDPSWESFCELIGDAASWMRSRGKRVVLGGMSPTDPNLLALLAERGALGDVDVVGVHGFPGGWTTVWSGWQEEVRAVRATLDRFGLSARVWITETGYSTWRDDEVGQLRAFVDALEAPVERVYWYAAEDLDFARPACDGFHVDPRHYAFGLHDSAGRPKLLARTLAGDGVPLARRIAATGRSPSRRRPAQTLVTGGAGFVGTNVVERLLQEGRRVRVLDSLARPGSEQNLLWLQARHPDRLSLELGDVRDRVALRRALRDVEEVFHLAAQVAVTTSLDDPLHDFQVNLGATVALLDELRRLPGPPRLLYTSTNKVYGSLADVPLAREGDRWQPVDPTLRARGVDELRPLGFCTPYGCSKGGGDQYVLDYATSFGVPAVVFRMSCIYGPHQHGNEDQGWVAHFLLSALERRPITIYGDGAQVRDILFVDDLVGGMLLATAAADRLAGTAFNIGGGPANTTSLLELLDLIEGLTGERPLVRFEDERVGDQRYYVSDSFRFRDATGWRPEVGVAEGVARLRRWLAARRPHRTLTRSAGA
jgi:CDP-paratose 2-epimerase